MMQGFEKFLAYGARLVAADSNGVVALYKPCGVLSMPNEEKEIVRNALFTLPYDFSEKCYIFPDGKRFFLLNRLDAPTSGIVIGCLTAEIADEIRKIFFNQKVYKEYRALVGYKTIAKFGEFRDELSKNLSDGHLRVASGRGNLAITKYSVIDTWKLSDVPLLLLKLEPITGRTHQLRVQCASRNLPIIGDKIYGDFSLNRKLWKFLPSKRLCLQSCAIKFEYSFGNKKYLFAEKVPYEF